MNNIGYINLSTKEVSSKAIPEEILRMYLGGRGLGAYLLYNHVDKGVDPLSPQNALIFSAGLLGGYFATAYGRLNFTGKSADTGIYGSSNLGGAFASELKYAGFQHLLIEGKAEKPSYILIRDSEIEIRDASHLWGLDTFETQKRIWEELKDPGVQILSIGQAGEKLFRLACVKHGVKRAAGKTGLGCPMGSKLLKAVAVRGSQGLPVKFPEKLLEVTKRQSDTVRRFNTFRLNAEQSNSNLFMLSMEQGWLPAYNRRKNYFPEGYGTIDIGVFLDNYKEKMRACHGCAMHCTPWFKIKSGPYAGTVGEGPHWISQNVWGSYIGNTRWDVSLKAQEVMDKYGIDVLGMGIYMGWLMELWERGLIDEKQTGGLKFEWGNPDAIMGLLDQIAQGVGLGKTISDGADKAIERLGQKTGEYLYRCGKGLPQECVNDHNAIATALGEYTANRGNDHLSGRVALELANLPAEALKWLTGEDINPDPSAYDTKAAFAIWYQDILTMCDATGLCKFRSQWYHPRFPGFKDVCEVIYAVTGWDMTPEELREASQRIWTMEKLFNLREGLGRKGDMPPKNLFEPLPDGPAKGAKLDRERFEKLLDEYYELRGWDKDGIPKRETLQRLKLDKEPAHVL